MKIKRIVIILMMVIASLSLSTIESFADVQMIDAYEKEWISLLDNHGLKQAEIQIIIAEQNSFESPTKCASHHYAVKTDGTVQEYITIFPYYFTLNEELQRRIIFHEMGHGIESRVDKFEYMRIKSMSKIHSAQTEKEAYLMKAEEIVADDVVYMVAGIKSRVQEVGLYSEFTNTEKEWLMKLMKETQLN